MCLCKHGTHKNVKVINKQNSQEVVVDACIADEIQRLNDQGIITLGCCCGHGQAGEIAEWENASGKWKSHHEPPHALIDESSVEDIKNLGYRPYPYYYADGEYRGVWQMFLKTGCVTKEEVEQWHENNSIK